MSDETVRLSTIGLIVRRRWRLLAALAVLGALLGAGASLLLSPGYRTSTSVLLQGPRKSDELLTETQVAMSSVVLSRVADAIGGGLTLADVQQSVTADVAEGNVIAITSTAGSPERAQQLADHVAQEYIRFSTQLASDTGDITAQVLRERREQLRQQIAQTNDRINELHARAAQSNSVESVQVRTELQGLRSTLTEAMTKLENADLASSEANLVVMGPAERPSGRAAPTMAHFAAGGALVFFVLGVFGHLAAARADRRLRREPDIAAALGSPVLAGVDVPDEPPAGEPPPGEPPAGHTRWWVRLLRLLSDGQPWDVTPLQASGDDQSREIRYRRALARANGDSAGFRRLLVLVPDDDATARRAAGQLAATARADGRMALRVVEVTPDHPTVPDRDDESGVVVVLSAGTRTGWELVEIAEACADAGHEVVGAVVAHRTRPVDHRPGEPAAAVPVDDEAMAAPA